MKIDKNKINFRKIDEHVSMIYHETDIIKFWTPELTAPFGIDENFGKHYIRVEIDENNTKENQLKKIIEKMEDILMKKLNIEENELKKIIRRKVGDKEIMDIRLKTIRNKMITECEYENERDNYLKTVYELDKGARVKIYLEIHGFWDHRDENGEKLDHKVGIILNALKIKVMRNNSPEFYIG